MTEQIQSILTEWTYRLPKGYPTSDSDYQVLYDVLQEMTAFSREERDRIVTHAKGIVEQSGEEPQPTTDTNQLGFSDATDFENYVLDRYAVNGQSIIGLQPMYDAIVKTSDSSRLIQLIKGNSTMELHAGAYPIRGIYNTLYDIIEHTIKIPNGDQSELWFAIAFKGKVAGAVAGDSGIEADIEVGDETVSLKNYNKITFDFGSLPANGTQLLNEFLDIAKLLTSQDISKSKGARQINTVLDFLDNESVEAQVRQLIQMSETTDIELIRNIGNRLKKFYSLSDNLDKMISAFCHIVDTTLEEKVLSVGWWGIIIKPNRTLYLEPASDIYESIRCKNDRLSNAIANFHQNKLFVLGSQLNTKVTTKSQDY